jgi:hypothetical protein
MIIMTQPIGATQKKKREAAADRPATASVGWQRVADAQRSRLIALPSASAACAAASRAMGTRNGEQET